MMAIEKVMAHAPKDARTRCQRHIVVNSVVENMVAETDDGGDGNGDEFGSVTESKSDMESQRSHFIRVMRLGVVKGYDRKTQLHVRDCVHVCVRGWVGVVINTKHS